MLQRRLWRWAWVNQLRLLTIRPKMVAPKIDVLNSICRFHQEPPLKLRRKQKILQRIKMGIVHEINNVTKRCHKKARFMRAFFWSSCHSEQSEESPVITRDPSRSLP